MSLGHFDSWMLLSFGGPDGPEDVIPFLQNVTRGRNVPDERLAEVAEQYHLFGGRSPINEQNLALMAAVNDELDRRGHALPGVWGNRNWEPYLDGAVAELAAAGHRSTVCLVTSAFSSYSGCRQYHEDIARATGSGDGGPAIRRVRVFWNHPDFLGTVADIIQESLEAAGWPSSTHCVFTAHSIPISQAATCEYADQLAAAVSEVARLAGLEGPVELAYQSRSGPPAIPWLEPDVGDVIEGAAGDGVERVVVVPLGFVSDHMEVVFDLDTQAAERAAKAGVEMLRVPTVGTRPRFVSMLVDLMEEAAGLREDRPAVGPTGPRPDQCRADCCPAPVIRRPGAAR